MADIKAADLIAKFQYALDNKWGYIWGSAGAKWTDASQQALVNSFKSKYGANWKTNAQAKKADKYYGALYGSKWIGHTVADCSGLFYWAFKKLGGYMYHGSNTMYNKYCTSKGKLNKKGRTDGKELKPGTAVFTGSEGKHGHVGLYVGNNLVIEASGTTAGVITTKISNGKWTYWGELKGVIYSTNSITPAPSNSDEFELITTPVTTQTTPVTTQTTPATIRRGDKGIIVKLAQNMLQKLKYNIGSSGIDGVFGQMTEQAAKKFQKDNKLTVDGIIGKKTWTMLFKKFEGVDNTSTIVSNLGLQYIGKLEPDK